MYLTLYAGPSHHALVARSQRRNRQRPVTRSAVHLFFFFLGSVASRFSMVAAQARFRRHPNKSSQLEIILTRVRLSVNFNIRLMFNASRVPLCVFLPLLFFFDWQWAARLSFSFSRSCSPRSLDLSLFLSHNTLSRSCTRKKRRRRTAYGRGLYKINNDTSTKLIKGGS